MGIKIDLDSSVVYTHLVINTAPEYRESGTIGIEVYDGKRKPKFILYLDPEEKAALRKALDDA